MKALTYRGIRSIHYEDVPDPVLHQPSDALVAVELAAICGSDLHVYRGREVGLDPGTVLGHEFVGRVVEIGSEVRRFHVGDRIACPFTTSCGGCFFCQRSLSARCVAGELFGWVERGRGLQGVQAERVRVPLADTTLIPIEDLPAEQAILLGDVLPTGWHCARMAGIEPDGTYAVIGCGPVGLMAIAAARELGAGPLFAIDRVPERDVGARELAAIFTHRLPLARGAEGYEAFDGQRDGCIKVGLTP